MTKVKPRVLIIGATGFVGGHLQRYLRDQFELNTPHHSLDIRDAPKMDAIVAAARPDWVVHLAAISNVPDSFADPRQTFDVNFLGTLNILLALREHGFNGRFLYISSSQVYGLQSVGEPPLSEDRLPRPANPYAVSKLASEALCQQWCQTERFQIVMARPFNHIGPGQSQTFVVPNFARQIAEIKRGLREPYLDVGNLDTTRDFTDVRDVVRAYKVLLESGDSGEVYNVCSGVETSIRTVVETLSRIAGIKVGLRPAQGRFRTVEQGRMVGSASKLSSKTGWKPEITFDESLKSIFDDQDHELSCLEQHS
jgi:GDP-4-dehydro-6-deoxy-D-mannose reductase